MENTFNPSKDTEQEMKILLRSIRTERSRFIIVRYNHYDLVRRVQQDLKNAYPQRHYQYYNLNDKNQKDLLDLSKQHLSRVLLATQNTVIFIEHTEILLQNTNVATALNQKRDAFLNKNIIVIFFVATHTSLNDFFAAMPDIYSIVSPILDLEQVIIKNNTGNLATTVLNGAKFNNSTEAQTEKERITQRLSELDSIPENLALRIQLLFELHETEHFLGNYQQAKQILEQLLDDHKDKLDILEINNIEAHLAKVYILLGDYTTAKALLEKVLISDIAHYPENHYMIAERENDLAIVLQDLGDYNGAKVLLEKAMISAEANFGGKHPTTAVRYNNLALVLQDLGDYSGAKVLLEKAMLSDEANFGEKHPTTAVRYSNLAGVLQDLGDYNGAKVLLEKAMISNEANFGEKHPTTAVSYSNLAMVLKDLKEYEKAIRLAIKAYRIYAGHLGQQHPTSKIIEVNLGVIKNEMLRKGWTMEQIQTLLNT